MGKLSNLLCLILLLFGSITAHAARVNPGLAAVESQHKGGDQSGNGDYGVMLNDEGCRGISEEECMIRRTLAAHVDYIYTQKHNKP